MKVLSPQKNSVLHPDAETKEGEARRGDEGGIAAKADSAPVTLESTLAFPIEFAPERI